MRKDGQNNLQGDRSALNFATVTHQVFRRTMTGWLGRSVDADGKVIDTWGVDGARSLAATPPVPPPGPPVHNEGGPVSEGHEGEGHDGSMSDSDGPASYEHPDHEPSAW